jgi:hypothetical protein
MASRPRNDIASENGISSGAVTNIVNEWRHNLGFALADELRELAIAFRKGNMTKRSDLNLKLRDCELRSTA